MNPCYFNREHDCGGQVWKHYTRMRGYFLVAAFNISRRQSSRKHESFPVITGINDENTTTALLQTYYKILIVQLNLL